MAGQLSDLRLEEIDRLQQTLNDWNEDSTGSPKKAEKLIQLYRKEGLEGFLDIAYGYAALAYNAVGDAAKANKFAKLAAEALNFKEGPNGRDMEMWKELTANPKHHWSWRWRKRT